MCFILIIANRILQLRYVFVHLAIYSTHTEEDVNEQFISSIYKKYMREKNSTLENLTKLS